jgi:hypothetical protein
VRDPDGLKVEVGDHGVIRATRGSSTRLEWSRRRRLLRGGDALPCRGVEEALRLGDLASKSVSRGALVLPSEGSHTHALLSSGDRGICALQGRSEGVVSSGDRLWDAAPDPGGRRWRRRAWAEEEARRVDCDHHRCPERHVWCPCGR